MTFPVEQAPFDDVRVRRAVAKAIDREGLAWIFGFGEFISKADFLAANTRFYQPNNDALAYDVRAANTLLDQAGYTGLDAQGYRTRDGQRLKATLLTYDNPAFGASVSVTSQADLNKVGFDMPIEMLPLTRVTERRYAGKFQALAAPSFVIGILLLLVFSFHWHWLPPFGSTGWRSLILPSVALALPGAAVLTQLLRQSPEETLEQPFIAMARARGLSETAVRLRHALRHALVPLVTLAGFVFASLLGGAVVVELLFARQGIGRLMLDATSNKDVPMVLGVTLLAATVYVVVNLAVDLINRWIDPRAARA